MKPGDTYYDGPIISEGKTPEEIDREIAEEKERMKNMDWDSYLSERYPEEYKYYN